MDDRGSLLGTSKGTSLEIAPGALGLPGRHGRVRVVPQWKPGSARDLAAQTPQHIARYAVDLLLQKGTGGDRTIKGDFTPEDGGSLLLMPDNAAEMQIGGQLGGFKLSKNSRGEIAMISCHVDTDSFPAARFASLDAIGRLLDHLSYTSNTPIATGMLRIRNERSEEQEMAFVVPYNFRVLAPAMFAVKVELDPVYALYREAIRSESVYYRVLCFAKIMEGLLKSLRAPLNARARAKGTTTGIPKEVVPAVGELPPALAAYVGKPIKEFYDREVTKGYRDAAAHFALDSAAPLRLSAPQEQARFADMAVLCDACVRLMIMNHEAAIDRIDPSTPPPMDPFTSG